ncbi:MAG: hypothetical protein MUF64_21730 [Polyangiaceae bacterium]|jgi:hypothetical protein|nr:hypothetical protein [Polyangiaceae bacterium]
MPLLLSRRAGLLLASSAFLPDLGCSPSGPSLRYDLSKLPPYEGELAQLFDDSIDPAVFGLTMAESGNLEFNPKFRRRTQDADVLSVVRITTVTVSKAEGKSSFALRFEKTRDFKAPFDDELQDLAVTEQTPQMFSIISAVQARARGRSMIGFWKRFRQQDRAVLHVQFQPDNPDTTKAIQDALALEDLKK